VNVNWFDKYNFYFLFFRKFLVKKGGYLQNNKEIAIRLLCKFCNDLIKRFLQLKNNQQ